jgi:uncharacterized protein (TIGR00369 family)
MKPIPEHGSCLVCGKENPHSFGAQWFFIEEGNITGKVTLTEQQQGPPNFAHGGASAALVDEAMGMAVWSAGHPVVAVNLNVDFHKPVPLNQEINITGKVTDVREDGKVVHAQAEIILTGETVAVSAKGTFVKAPQFFDKFLNNDS